MTRFQRIAALTLCVVVAAGAIVPMLKGMAPGTPKPAGRSEDAIVKELGATDEKVQTLAPSIWTAVGDPEFRKGEGAKVLPLLKKIIHLYKELETAGEAEELREIARIHRYQTMSLAAALADNETITELESMAKGRDVNAVSARSSLALTKWFTSTTDAAAQTKLLDEYSAIAKDNPTNVEVALSLQMMANSGFANNSVAKKVIAVIRENLKGDDVNQLLALLDSIQGQRDLVGQPLAFDGRTSSGGKFALSSFKGKVVLVDFWATWCPGCIDELPAIKKVYKEYHEKGLEVVGVSSDSDEGKLNTFIQENGMPWVQLRETSQDDEHNMHPLARRYSVTGIPALFLIDKKGVLRDVDSYNHLADKVQKLLAEPEAPPAK